MPANDRAADADRRVVVGVDPFTATLVVIPFRRAVADAEWVRVLSTSTTLGEVRQNADAWGRVVEGETPEGLEGAAADWPDDTPFDWETWFGPDTFSMEIPLARLRTAEVCPAPVLEQYGREDTESGLDYERATWPSPDEQGEIEARLLELGYEAVHDDDLLKRYLG